jgi:hypothetical protein
MYCQQLLCATRLLWQQAGVWMQLVECSAAWRPHLIFAQLLLQLRLALCCRACLQLQLGSQLLLRLPLCIKGGCCCRCLPGSLLTRLQPETSQPKPNNDEDTRNIFTA